MKVLRGLLACSVGPRLHQDRHGDVKASFLNSAPTVGGGAILRVVADFERHLGALFKICSFNICSVQKAEKSKKFVAKSSKKVFCSLHQNAGGVIS